MRRILLIVSVCVATSAIGEVYRWTDENGQVHFGERPPVDGAQRIELPASPPSRAGPDSATAPRRARQQRLLDAYQYEREQKHAAAQEAAQARRADARRCEKLRRQWRRLSHGGPIFVKRDDGSRDYLDDSRRAAEKARLLPEFRRTCGESPE